MKKTKKTIIGLAVIWLVTVIMLVLYYRTIGTVDYKAFESGASISRTEDKVGAKVSLKEEIHGIDSITYRYIVKTDCDKRDFETRYVTNTPLKWVNNKTSAVETIVYDIQIRYDGTVYGSGTYYIVPLLDNIASENMSLEEWKKNLVKQAYQTYKAAPGTSVYVLVLTWFIVALPICVIAYLIIISIYNKLDQEAKEAWNLSQDQLEDVRKMAQKNAEKTVDENDTDKL